MQTFTKYAVACVLLLLGTWQLSAQCTYTLEMNDSYGDGWNGGNMDLLVNGTVVLDDVSASGSQSLLTFSVNTGDQITTVFGPGGIYPSEISYRVLDSDGVEVGSGNATTDITTAIAASCPTCASPTGLVANGLSATSGMATWDNSGAASYEYVVVAAGAGSDAAAVANAMTTDTTATFTGLSASTSYDVHVRGVCGPGDTSTYSSAASFVTQAAVVAAPYTESFDAGIPSNFTLNATSGGPWTTLGGFSWNTSGCSPAPSENTGTVGSTAMALDHSSTDAGVIAELPPVDISALSTPNLQFDYYMCGSGYTPLNITYVEAFTSGSWGIVATIQEGSGAWVEYNYDVSTYAENDIVRLRFRAESGGASTDYYGDVAIDDISIDEAPSCATPSNLASSGNTATQATINWTENGAATSWEVSYNDGTTAAVAIANSNPYTLMGLDPNTTYTIGVRAICAPGDTSDMSASISVLTDCEAVSLPWSENFDEAASLPNCWKQDANNGKDWEFGSLATYGPTEDHTSGSGNFAWIDDSSPSDVTSSLISPSIAVSGLDAPILEFWLWSESHGTPATFKLYIDVDAGSGFNVVDSFDVENTTWEVQYVDLSDFNEQTVKIRFRGFDTPGYQKDIGIDDIAIIEAPSCFAPVGLTASATSLTTGEASWSPVADVESYVWVLTPQDSVPGGDYDLDQGSVTDTTLIFEELVSGTAYTLYVASACDGGNSDYAAFDFETPIIGDACTAPHELALETSYVDSTHNYTFTLDGTNDACGQYGATSGADVWYAFTPAEDMIVTMSLTGLDEEYARVSVVDGCGSDANCAGSMSNGFSTNDLMSSEFALTSGTTYYFIVRQYSSSYATNYTFEVNQVLCSGPVGATISSETVSGAQIDWTSGAGCTSQVVEWGLDGFTPGTGDSTAVACGTAMASITGLMSASDYDVYVTNICSDSTRNTLGPVSFTTLCDVFVPEVMEAFDSYPPNCWSEANGQLGSVVTEGGSSWTSDGFANNGSTGAAKMNIYSTGRNEWMISPSIDLSGGSYQLEFDIALTAYASSSAGTMGSDDTVAVVISTDNGATWDMANVVALWDGTSTISNTGQTEIIDLSAYSGTVKVGFYAASSMSNADNDLFIDNFRVRTPPSCEDLGAVTVTDVTTNTVDFSFENPEGHTSFVATAVPTGDDVNTGALVTLTDTVGTITGLSAQTEYDLYVRAVCAPGDSSSWTAAANFTTQCNTFALPFAEDFESTSTTLTCWRVFDVNGDGTSWATSATSAANGTSQGIYVNWNGSLAMNDWLVSPAFATTPGEEYSVSFWYGNRSSYAEKMRVRLEESNIDSTGTGMTIFNDDNIVGDSMKQVTVIFTATESEHRLSFHGYSIAGQWELRLDEVSVMEYTAPLAPAISAPADDMCARFNQYGVAGMGWSQVFDADNNLIAEINANGNDLGLVTIDRMDIDGAAQSPNGTYYVSRYFHISPSKPGPFTVNGGVKVRLYYTDAELAEFNAANGSSLGWGDLALSQYSNDNGTENCDITDNTTEHYVTTTITNSGDYGSGHYVEFQVTGFSEFGLNATGGALPVELMAFDARAEETSNLLTWETATEEALADFVVERSLDGQSFETIGKVAAIGNSVVAQDYRYEDQEPALISYYRLRMVDVDGAEQLSEIVVVEREATRLDIAQVFPVPTSGLLNVQLSSETERTLDLVVTDVFGKEVLRQQVTAAAGITTHGIDLSTLTDGVYQVTITDGASRITRRVVKR